MFSVRVETTWILPLAKFVPAPGWHWPHVLARLAAWMGDLGSAEVRMSWKPWQLAQLATRVSPNFEAVPW